MIIVYFKGGLGNQLFQYALGRHLAEIHGTVLKMDISAYDYDGPLEYYLAPFNVVEEFATESEINKLKYSEGFIIGGWFHNLLHNHPKRPKTFIRWNRPAFNPKILDLPDNIYMEGYWNSGKYFKNIENIIRDELTFKTPAEDKNKEILDQIKSCQSVCIHVRRGDYISDNKTSSTHGVCDMQYYLKCINHMSELVKKPQYFIFSDDPQWCSNNLKLPCPAIFVDNNSQANAFQDLRLMSNCQHQIIANSTFSWWAAWLNRNKNKIVCAPKNWFANKKYNIDDIIPSEWIKT